MNENSPLMGLEPDSPRGKTRLSNEQVFASIAAALVEGVVGMVFTSNYVNIDIIATKLGTTSVDIGSIFIVDAVGAVVGGLFWPLLYHTFGGPNTIFFVLIALVLLCIGIGYCTWLSVMYVLYFLSSLCISLLDTGGFAMLRVIHNGKDSVGPWISASVIVFRCGGLVAVLLSALTDWLSLIYICVAAIVAGIAAYCFCYLIPGQHAEEEEPIVCSKIDLRFFVVEILCGLALGCVDGTNSSITSYLETYIEDKDLIGYSTQSYVIVLYWIALIGGELVVLFTQEQCATENLLWLQVTMVVPALAAVCFVLAYSDSASVLWGAMFMVGLCNGAAFCLIADVSNRLSSPSALSSTIVMFGLSSLVTLMPYAVSAVWDYSDAGPASLFYVIIAMLPLSLMVQFAPRFQVDKKPI